MDRHPQRRIEPTKEALMEIRPLEPDDQDAVERFLEHIPQSDRTFFKEAVDDPAVVSAWAQAEGGRWLAVDHGKVAGYVAIVPLHGFSSHVGEIRLVVDPQARGQGVGTAMARHAVVEALRLGLTKMVVEVLADQEFTVEMFSRVGFDPEALLVGQVKDRSGELRDLLILAQTAEGGAAAIAASGIADEVPL
jgi:ribosomal protein S18 acetylase RimI-like enzyme